MNFHQWDGCGCFLEIKKVKFPALKQIMHISDQLLSQRLFQGLVFMFTSVEKTMSRIR